MYPVIYFAISTIMNRDQNTTFSGIKASVNCVNLSIGIMCIYVGIIIIKYYT